MDVYQYEKVAILEQGVGGGWDAAHITATRTPKS